MNEPSSSGLPNAVSQIPPVPPQEQARQKWLSALSIGVGFLAGIMVGPWLFFFLYIFAIPIGLVVGGTAGVSWGRRNPLTTTGFAALGVHLGEAVFILGERFLKLPTRAWTWGMAPVIGVLGIWLLPLLAKKIWPEQRTRENAAMVSVLGFLIVPFFLWSLLPKDPIQADTDSAAAQNAFYTKCANLAEAEGHHATRDLPAAKPAPHLLQLRTFPTLCCPGIVVPRPNTEANLGDWHILMTFLTKASFADTVAYYQRLLPGTSLRQKPVDVPYPCTRISGSLYGEPVTVIVADVPERGVNIAIY